MSDQKRDHEHSESEKHPHGGHGRKLHKDWRLWLAVGLMLLCMLIYVFTLDDSVRPGSQPAGNPPPTNAVPVHP